MTWERTFGVPSSFSERAGFGLLISGYPRVNLPWTEAISAVEADRSIVVELDKGLEAHRAFILSQRPQYAQAVFAFEALDSSRRGGPVDDQAALERVKQGLSESEVPAVEVVIGGVADYVVPLARLQRHWMYSDVILKTSTVVKGNQLGIRFGYVESKEGARGVSIFALTPQYGPVHILPMIVPQKPLR